MIRRNVANQSFLFGALINASSGSPETTGASVQVCKDLGSFSAGAGTLTHVSDGVWEYRPTQSETDCSVFKAVLSKSGAVAQSVTVLTTACNPQDSDAFGISRIDATVSSRSTLTASDVWSAGTRTLTSFGSLASDVATAVWSAGTRTLTSFGTLVSDIWNNATRSLTSYLDSSGVTTLLGRVIGTIASGTHQPQSGDAYARIGANGSGLTSLGDSRLANLDATVSSRLASSGYTAPDNASIAGIKAKTDNLPSDPASASGVSSTVASYAKYALPKNTAVTVPFVMTDSTTHSPVTGKTVTAQISKDGGSFVSTSGSPVEIGSGAYKVALTSSETNCTSVHLRLTASGCDDQHIIMFTQG